MRTTPNKQFYFNDFATEMAVTGNGATSGGSTAKSTNVKSLYSQPDLTNPNKAIVVSPVNNSPVITKAQNDAFLKQQEKEGLAQIEAEKAAAKKAKYKKYAIIGGATVVGVGILIIIFK